MKILVAIIILLMLISLIGCNQPAQPAMAPLSTSTPTPIPTPTPEPTPEPLTDLELNARIAVEFLKKHLKNPQSLQIHSVDGYFLDKPFSGFELTEEEKEQMKDILATPESYEVRIDYSAQNSFGGYNREYFYVKIVPSNNTVSVMDFGQMLYRDGKAEIIDVDRIIES